MPDGPQGPELKFVIPTQAADEKLATALKEIPPRQRGRGAVLKVLQEQGLKRADT